MRPWRTRSLASVLLFLVVACGGRGGGAVPPSSNPRPAAAPAEAVERFMRLVAAKQYAQMGYVFGNREGPIISRDTEQQVERRMYAVADILQHDRFVIRGEQPIPGRGPDVAQLTVQITKQGQTHDVPFVVVRTAAGGWLVEQIDLEAITKQQ